MHLFVLLSSKFHFCMLLDVMVSLGCGSGVGVFIIVCRSKILNSARCQDSWPMWTQLVADAGRLMWTQLVADVDPVPAGWGKIVPKSWPMWAQPSLGRCGPKSWSMWTQLVADVAQVPSPPSVMQ